MKRIKVLTDSYPTHEEEWGLVEKFYGLLMERFPAIEQIAYQVLPDEKMTLFDISIRECKRSVLSELKKTLKGGKRYFIVDYKIEKVKEKKS